MRIPHKLSAFAAAAALVLAPTAAHAGTEAHVDKVGDVVQVDFDNEAFIPTPSRTQGDITTIQVVHGLARVRVRMTFRKLDATPNTINFHEFRVRTPSGGRRVLVMAGPGLLSGTHDFATAAGDPLRCKGLKHRIDYPNERITVLIPRSCLGDPRWVRAGGGTVVGEPGSDDVPMIFVDDARSQTVSPFNVALGPKVFRAVPASATDS